MLFFAQLVYLTTKSKRIEIYILEDDARSHFDSMTYKEDYVLRKRLRVRLFNVVIVREN